MPHPSEETTSCRDPGLTKADVRRRALAARDALPAAERARLSVAVCERAAHMPEIAASTTLLLFASFRSEVDTRPLVTWSLEQAKTVCFPRVVDEKCMAAYRVEDPAADLVPGAWGIPEPRDGLELVSPDRLDVVAIPGAAFDCAGRRCGYGGGFYDCYLPLTRPQVPRVALAFEAQLVEDLPCEPHDVSVTAIVTEKRVIRPS